MSTGEEFPFRVELDVDFQAYYRLHFWGEERECFGGPPKPF